MFREELKNLERHTRELEAVKNYAQTREERDSLAAEAAQLRDKLGRLEVELKREVGEKEQLSLRADKSETAVKDLSLSLDEARRELSSLRDFQLKLPQGVVVSLGEMRSQFLEIEEGEIETRTKVRLEEMEKGLRSQMPALVYERLMEMIKHPGLPPEIDEVINSRAGKMADERLRDKDKWPDWFKEHYLNEVKELVRRELDSEFEKSVKVEAERIFSELKAGKWQEYTAHKARRLTADLKGLVGELQGTWSFTCDRCGRRLARELGPSDIGVLLSGGTIEVVCTACSDPAPFPFILSTIPHKVSSLTLGGLLRIYIGKPPAR